MDTEKPGMRLKRLIRAQWPPVTQAAFARRLGVNPTQLGHWLAGRREPRNGSFWLAAARELGIDPSELISDHLSDKTELKSDKFGSTPELVA